MTVQNLIDELNKLTNEEKSLPITMNVCSGYDSIENAEIDDFCISNEYGWINNTSKGSRKVVLLME